MSLTEQLGKLRVIVQLCKIKQFPLIVLHQNHKSTIKRGVFQYTLLMPLIEVLVHQFLR
jgi:hypothetical protein